MTPLILPPGFTHFAVTQVDSTNDEARRQVQNGSAADLLVISARTQTQGRGRRGRAWISPAGNLHCSLVLATGGDLGRAAQAGFVASMALVDSLHQLVPHTAFTCKWPNDVLAAGRKVAGMLLEPVGTDWLILGLGVDVAACPPDDQVQYPAVHLASLGFAGTDQDVLGLFCHCLAPHLRVWRQDGFGPIRDGWLARAAGVGEAVTVRLEDETLVGHFSGLDQDGALLLDCPGHPQRRIMAGDVHFAHRG